MHTYDFVQKAILHSTMAKQVPFVALLDPGAAEPDMLDRQTINSSQTY